MTVSTITVYVSTNIKRELFYCLGKKQTSPWNNVVYQIGHGMVQKTFAYGFVI